jgi:hypothetical protein
MIASSWAMSAAMWSRASSSATLISVSRRRRASGVRRSCEMPASMMARSCSILASWSAMRLKPMLTARISLVRARSSSRCASYSPSRTCMVARDSCLSGRLMSRVISAAPASESAIGGAEPDQPGAAAHAAEARGVEQQPVGVALDGEADPQARLVVHAAGHGGAFAELVDQLLGHAQVERAAGVGLEAVVGLARQDAHAFLVGQRLDQRDPGDGVRIHQRRAREVHERGDLVGRLNGARLVFERAESLQPGDRAADQQQREQEESAPEKAEAQLEAGAAVTLGALQRARHRDLRAVFLLGAGSGGLADGHLSAARQAVPSGTNT